LSLITATVDLLLETAVYELARHHSTPVSDPALQGSQLTIVKLPGAS
jgi:hypothetical protein